MARNTVIVTDIGYGDAGKGTTVDYLVRQASSNVVVRHNGGPQAAHNVITPDGRHHTFAQFASGSFVPGVKTHLSRFMLVNPLNMMREAEHLISLGVDDIWRRLSVDETCLVILPWHQAANRLREIARGGARHGSCGQGVGEAQSDAIETSHDAIRVRELASPSLSAHLEYIRDAKYAQLQRELAGTAADDAGEEWEAFTDPHLIPWLCKQYRYWRRLVRVVPGSYLRELADSHEQVVFEGAQGVLLDEWYGFHPYTTWSTTTPANALVLLSELGIDTPVKKLGVMRAYATRHGPGPFVSEDARLASSLREYHNDTGQWQGAFRYGHLDLMAHAYATTASGGIDELAITGIDRLAETDGLFFCDRYRLDEVPQDADKYFECSGNMLGSIKLGPFMDLEYQARLTELLTTCSPVYQRATQETELLKKIESILGLPITLASFGPTADDKRAYQQVGV